VHFHGKNALSSRKSPFFIRNNHVPKEKEFKLPWEQLKPFFPLKKKSLNYLVEQLKPFYSPRNNHAPEKEFKLPWGTT
jgi:hypothetical protein